MSDDILVVVPDLFISPHSTSIDSFCSLYRSKVISTLVSQGDFLDETNCLNVEQENDHGNLRLCLNHVELYCTNGFAD